MHWLERARRSDRSVQPVAAAACSGRAARGGFRLRRCRLSWIITMRCGCGLERALQAGRLRTRAPQAWRLGGLRCCRPGRSRRGRACGGSRSGRSWMRICGGCWKRRHRPRRCGLSLGPERWCRRSGWTGRGAAGPAAAVDPPSGGGRGVVADPGSRSCGGVGCSGGGSVHLELAARGLSFRGWSERLLSHAHDAGGGGGGSVLAANAGRHPRCGWRQAGSMARATSRGRRGI